MIPYINGNDDSNSRSNGNSSNKLIVIVIVTRALRLASTKVILKLKPTWKAISAHSTKDCFFRASRVYVLHSVGRAVFKWFSLWV